MWEDARGIGEMEEGDILSRPWKGKFGCEPRPDQHAHKSSATFKHKLN